MKTKKQPGFTLIEIIVVLIIIGVLAAAAVSNIFSWISKSKASEAMTTLSAYKNIIEGCIQIHPGQEGQCSSFYQGLPPSTSNFVYCQACGGIMLLGPYPPYDNRPNNWYISACDPNSIGSGQMVSWAYTSCITMTRTNGGVYTCSATGSYQGVC
jgi:prepilin-type N-terminal cleavage/methylation domain-containing protein